MSAKPRQFGKTRGIVPSAGGAASLDTEAVTQRVGRGDSHNLTARRFRLKTSRSEWLEQLESLTTHVREQAARRLESRGRTLALERRRLWRQSGLVAREEKTGRAASGPPKIVGWHASRAQGKRELFDRVDRCGTDDATRLTLVCRGCGDNTKIEVGCSSHWFCPSCRARTAQRFRTEFENKRLGLTTAAARAGLTRRAQRKSERWGARLLTLTLPHEGQARERIQVLQATWARFWRTLTDALRPKLQDPCGITLEDLPGGLSKRAFETTEAFLERTSKPLTFADLLSYVKVLEWTPGDDQLGHPHLHVWLFSRYLEQAWLQELWEQAYAHVTHTPRRTLALVHIEAAGDDVAHELVKYLTKDWEMSADGAKRASPAVFAQVYAELADKRLRQTSAGFAMWGVEKFKACPCCGFERERGHWARVDITHALDSHPPLSAPQPLPNVTRGPLTAAPTMSERELELWLAAKQKWAASPEARAWFKMIERNPS
jgi:rubrerythrin